MMSAATASHHDQTSAAAAAAYRGFPLSLGMTPYANHHLQRSSQDSPYDASITAACKQIYDGAYQKDCANKANTGAGVGGTGAAPNDTNGYKDVWNSTSANNGQQNAASVPVRPSACTPDSRVGGYIDAAGGSPVSRTGSTATGGAAAWNANCSLTGGGAPAQTAPSGLHQSNHTFYPWMAIAGEWCRRKTGRNFSLIFMVCLRKFSILWPANKSSDDATYK
jgi:Antp family, other